jgi:hypothetical protein
MSVEARAQALLDLVEADRTERCAAIVDEARAQAAALRAEACAEARAQVRAAYAEQRLRVANALAAAEAELQTRRRLHAQRQVEALLALAWARLPEVLRMRWDDPGARDRWLAHALASARERLPRTAWTLQHGPGWPDAERQALAARLEAELGHAPQFVEDARLGAGLRIAAGSNVVDVTLAGLLADRDEIGGRLIGLLEGSA